MLSGNFLTRCCCSEHQQLETQFLILLIKLSLEKNKLLESESFFAKFFKFDFVATLAPSGHGGGGLVVSRVASGWEGPGFNSCSHHTFSGEPA